MDADGTGHISSLNFWNSEPSGATYQGDGFGNALPRGRCIPIDSKGLVLKPGVSVQDSPPKSLEIVQKRHIDPKCSDRNVTF
jgi:hypothetical protein